MDQRISLRARQARWAAGGMAEVIDLATAIKALSAYKTNLRRRGKLLQVRAIEHCIALLKRLA